MVGEVGLEPTKALASGFTVRPLCHSGHSPPIPPRRLKPSQQQICRKRRVEAPFPAARANPRRAIKRVVATPNALARLTAAGATLPLPPEETTPRLLDHLLGGEAVHQGVAVEVAPLEPVAIAT